VRGSDRAWQEGLLQQDKGWGANECPAGHSHEQETENDGG